MATAHGLNPGVMAALLSLDAEEPKPMRWVAEACHCDASNATWLVDRLEERGLVERRTPPEDRRMKTVALTPAGSELVAAIRAEVLRPPDAILSLQDDELDLIRTVFAKLAVPSATGARPRQHSVSLRQLSCLNSLCSGGSSRRAEYRAQVSQPGGPSRLHG